MKIRRQVWALGASSVLGGCLKVGKLNRIDNAEEFASVGLSVVAAEFDTFTGTDIEEFASAGAKGVAVCVATAFGAGFLTSPLGCSLVGAARLTTDALTLSEVLALAPDWRGLTVRV